MSRPVIQIENLTYAYNGQTALQDVDLSVDQGDFTAIIGPNGGGKTTLLKLMLGLLRPDSGSVRILGQAAGHASHLVGYVPQNTHINPDFPISALDVVLMGQLQPGGRRMRHSQRDRSAAREALDKMDVATLGHRRMGELSGGQRQRVFIARALVSQPQILMLDEPTAHIDTKGQTGFYTLLDDLNRDITILVVSHDLLVLSAHARSVACVNGSLHFHPRHDLLHGTTDDICPCTAEASCPVDLVTRRLPHKSANTCKEP